MRRKPHHTLRFAAFAAAAASLCACANLQKGAGLQPQALNVESPAAGAIMTVQAQRLPFPSFRDVPPKPADIPAAAGYAPVVASLNGERHGLNAWTVDNPPMLSGTESYASTTRQGVGATAADAPQQDVTPAISAWAKAMRAAATAPPPPQKPAAPPPPQP